MDLAYTLTGGAPMLKKYQVAASVARAGIPLLAPAANGAGLAACTTTSCAKMVGLVDDAAVTYVTAQQSDNSSPERLITVIINPDAVFRVKLSGAAAEDTALTLLPITTASTDGLTVTTNGEWSNPTYDEGTVWGYDGANVGQVRKITSVSSTAGTVTVAFTNDTVVGDNFLRAPWFPGQANTLTLTTNFTQARVDVAVATNTAEFRVIEQILRDIGDDGRNRSVILVKPADHAFAL